MTDQDDDPKVSVCLDCARHPSLKRMIAAKTVRGICAFCCRTDAQVRDPADTEPMVMLLRALIRFYWDEFDYNSHWGGNEVMTLFEDDANPVVTPAVADTYSDAFDYLLQDPPYPDVDKGISIYAGFDDGIRLVAFAISHTTPRIIHDLRGRVKTEEFTNVAPALKAALDPFLADLAIVLPAGQVWLRARTGVETSYHRVEGFESHIVRKPRVGASIAAPPAPGIGRLNRAGQPVLYLASKAYTALAEIRPHPGHYVSIGGFETQRALRLADFDPDIAMFSTNEHRLAQFEMIQAFDRMMSTPVTPDDKSGYLLTQLLAQVLQGEGFDGVRYRSSVSDGVNICLFDPVAARFVNGHSEVRFVQAVTYDAPEAPMVIEPEEGDYELKG